MRVQKGIGLAVFLLVLLGSSVMSLYWSSEADMKVRQLCESIKSLQGIRDPNNEDNPCIFFRFGAADVISSGTSPGAPGRFQIIVRPGVARDTWLLDTQTGEVWNIYEDPTTKTSWWGVMDKGVVKAQTAK